MGTGRGKRIVDVVLAVALLAVALLPMAVIALAIRISEPRVQVFYRQRRTGRGGATFTLLKFRTMAPDADERREELRALSTVAWPDFRVVDDPRVTRIGRWLRRTSLDELPQLVNVLRGDMSVVGPRPTSFHADTYDLWQTERLAYRPGLTGPWQVQGRTTMDFAERCRLEIAFFRTATARQELGILLRTAVVVVRRTGVA